MDKIFSIILIVGVAGFIVAEILGLMYLFWFTLIFGIFSFAYSKIFGVSNPAKIAGNIMAVVVFAPLFLFAIYASFNPSKSIELLPAVLNLWIQNLPGIIMGDVAGSLVAAITGTDNRLQR